MHESKLLYVIRTFTKKELQTLETYLFSPYFLKSKQGEDIRKLFLWIKKHLNKDKHPKLNKTMAYQHLFAGEREIKGKLEKTMTALLQQIYRFIAFHFSEFREDQDLDLLTIATYYRQRKAFKLYEKYLQNGLKNLESDNKNVPSHLYKQFLFEREAYEHQALWHQQDELYQLYDQLSSLDAFYLLNKLEYTCFFLSLGRFRVPMEIQDQVEFLELVKPLYQKRGILKFPIITIFYRTFELLKDEPSDENHYWDLKALLEQHENVIPFVYLKSLAIYHRNFIIFQYNQGALHLMGELFVLYKAHLAKGYLIEESGMIPSILKNVVTIGLRSKAFDWVYELLQEYQHKIVGTSFPQDVYHFNMATYHFHKREFDQSLALLADQYEDLFYKIAAKRLEIKVFYEIDSELLDAKMDAFKVYIFRLPKRSVLPHRRENDNNFVNFLRQLRNPKTKFDQQRITKLKNNISSCLRLSEKEWLLEKIAALAAQNQKKES